MEIINYFEIFRKFTFSKNAPEKPLFNEKFPKFFGPLDFKDNGRPRIWYLELPKVKKKNVCGSRMPAHKQGIKFPKICGSRIFDYFLIIF